MSHAAEKACTVCGNQMPAAGEKCVKCGSYQDWRRHLDIGNTSLAILVAAVSVFGIMVAQLIGLSSFFYSIYFSKFNAVLLDFSPDRLEIIESNPTSRLTVISRVICLLPLPLEATYFFNGSPDSTLSNIRWPRSEEIVGRVLIDYGASHREVVISGGIISQEFTRRHISRVFQNSLADAEAEEMAYCLYSGLNSQGEVQGGILVPTPGDLIVFDSAEIVRMADFSPEQEGQRVEILRRIEQARSNGTPASHSRP